MAGPQKELTCGSRIVCCLCRACCLQINVVMDYANGGSLFEYVQARTKLPEALARCEQRNSEWGGGKVQHKCYRGAVCSCHWDPCHQQL